MKHFIRLLLLLGTLFFVCAVVLFEGLLFKKSADRQEQQCREVMLPIKERLLAPGDRRCPEKAQSFDEINRVFEKNIYGFIGFQFKQREAVFYQSPQLESVAHPAFPWKNPTILQDGIDGVVSSHAFKRRLVFSNVLNRTEFVFYFTRLHEPFILNSLQFSLTALVAYLLFLIAIVFLLFLTAKKRPQAIPLTDTLSDSNREAVTLSLPTLQKAEALIQEAIKNETPFALAALSAGNRTEDTEALVDASEEAASFLETCLTVTHGFFEDSDHIRFLFFPNTSLEKALSTLQDYFSVLKADGARKSVCAGVTALNERSLSLTVLLMEAQKALEKAQDESLELLGFDADPVLYQEAINQALKGNP